MLLSLFAFFPGACLFSVCLGLLSGEAGELPPELGESGVPSAFLFLLGVEGRDPMFLGGLGGDFLEEPRDSLAFGPRECGLFDFDLSSLALVLGLRERLLDFLTSVSCSTALAFASRSPAAVRWASLISPLS